MVWWVRSDPCGLFSAAFTVFLVLYAQYVIVAVLILPWYGFCWHVLAYTFCSLMAIYSHSRAQFTSPGVVPKILEYPEVPSDDPDSQQIPKTCRRCRSVKPKAAHHCSLCSRCVLRMDHHCPWVNNCVAIFNQKYFLLFLFYTSLCCIYSGVLLVARFISCTHNMRSCSINGVQAALCVINFVEALVFGLFVIIMLFDQCAGIFEAHDGSHHGHNHGNSKDHHGHSHDNSSSHGKLSRYESLQQVFGEPFSWRWFVPLKMPQKIYDDFEKECNVFVYQTVRRRQTEPSQQAASSTLYNRNENQNQNQNIKSTKTT